MMSSPLSHLEPAFPNGACGRIKSSPHTRSRAAQVAGRNKAKHQAELLRQNAFTRSAEPGSLGQRQLRCYRKTEPPLAVIALKIRADKPAGSLWIRPKKPLPIRR
jgi:hypothetical protein